MVMRHLFFAGAALSGLLFPAAPTATASEPPVFSANLNSAGLVLEGEPPSGAWTVRLMPDSFGTARERRAVASSPVAWFDGVAHRQWAGVTERIRLAPGDVAWELEVPSAPASGEAAVLLWRIAGDLTPLPAPEGGLAFAGPDGVPRLLLREESPRAPGHPAPGVRLFPGPEPGLMGLALDRPEGGGMATVHLRISSWTGHRRTPDSPSLSSDELARLLDQASSTPDISALPGASAVSEATTLQASDGAPNNSFGASATLWRDMAAVGAPDPSGATAGAVYLSFRNTGGAETWGELKKLTPSDGAAGDRFGASVALWGDTLVVGAPGNASGRGAVYLFSRNTGGSNNWGQARKLVASDGAALDAFGSSVALCGERLIVGAPVDATSRGGAYLYFRNQGGSENWGQVKKIVASDGVAQDRFGASVSLEGDVALVGAEGADLGRGAAYLYYRNTGGAEGWGQVRKVAAPYAVAGASFGTSVSLSDGLALIGAPGQGEGGACYLFARNEGGADLWGLVRKAVPRAPTAGASFGASVLLWGATALVGAPGENGQAGAAYLLTRNLDAAHGWGELQRLQPATAAALDRAGTALGFDGDRLLVGGPRDPARAGAATLYALPSAFPHKTQTEPSGVTGGVRFSEHAVALDGDRLAVGAWLEDSNGYTEQGVVYLFERNRGGADGWGLVKKIWPTDGYYYISFGWAVALEGDTLVVGAPRAPATMQSLGAVRVFRRNEGGPDNWGQVRLLYASDGQMGASMGTSVALSGDTFVAAAPGYDYNTSLVDTGAAYLFQRNQGGADNWGQVKKVDRSTLFPSIGDQFGYSVALQEDHLFVGVPFRSPGCQDEGGISFYRRNQGGLNNWGYVKEILAGSDAWCDDYLGKAMALDGEFLAVGAPGDDVGGIVNQGSVVIYARNQGGADAWGRVTRITRGSSGVEFGSHLALQGDHLVVGVPRYNGSDGTCFRFRRNAGGENSWGYEGSLSGSAGVDYDQFGSGLALSRERVAVGEVTGGPNGRAHLFYNRGPAARDDAYQALSGTPLVVAAPGVLLNDGDSDGDPLTAGWVTNPAYGTLSLSAGGGFTYTPAPGYTGPDSFRYRTGDGSDSSTTAAVTLQVVPAAGLSLTKEVAPEPACLNQPLTYTLTVHNAGPQAAQGVVLTDDLPGAFQLSHTEDEDTVGEFGSGTYDRTAWNEGSGWIEPLSNPGAGWNLPGGGSPSGWVDMTGNALLLHMEGDWTDASGLGRNGSPVNGATFTGAAGAKVGADSGAFDGVNDYVNSTTFDIDDDFSIALWANPTAPSTDGQSLVAKHDSAANNLVIMGFFGGYHLRIRGAAAQVGTVVGGWQHLAVTGRKTDATHTEVTFYRDGVQLWQASLAAVIGDVSGGRAWVIGQEWDSGGATNFFKGQMDEVSIWNRTLSATEVAQLHREQAPLVGTFTSGVFDAGAEAAWGPLSWSPVRPGGPALPDGGSAETGYATGNADMAGNVLLLHLDGASQKNEASLEDTSGAGNTLTLSTGDAAEKAVPGVHGNALALNGGSGSDADYAVLAAPASFPTTALTAMLWVRTTDTVNGGGLFSYASAASDNDLLIIDCKDLRVYRGTAISPAVGVSVNDGRWHHVAVTWTSAGGQTVLYVDGVVRYSGALAAGTSLTPGGALILGQDQDSVGGGFDPTQAFVGAMDDVALFDRALAAGEVAAVYARGVQTLGLQVRSCDDPACDTEPFAGPDGTGATYFTVDTPGLTVPPTVTHPAVQRNRYFQYRALFDREVGSVKPGLDAVSFSYTPLSYSTTQGTCTGALECELGTVPAGGDVTVTLIVAPLISGSVINAASVLAETGDPNASDNAGTANASITPAAPLAPSAPTFSDPDICSQAGITLSWTPVALAEATDLRVDGTTLVSGAVSPYLHNPGDTALHNYEVRGRNAGCGAGPWSPLLQAADEDHTPTPSISGSATNPCPALAVVLQTEPGMAGYQWFRNGVAIVGAQGYQYEAALSASYTVSYTNGLGCSAVSSPFALSLSNCQPPPVADGKLAGTAATFARQAPGSDSLSVTYDSTTCSSPRAVVVYGTLGNFSGYQGCAGQDIEGNGSETIDTTGLVNVWFNILWASGTVAGHPGYAFNGTADTARTWTAAGRCGMTSDNHQNTHCLFTVVVP